MASAEQPSNDQNYLKDELALIFPDLTDDIYWDTVLDQRNKKYLQCVIRHLSDHGDVTRDLDDVTSPKHCTDDLLHQACSMDAMHIPTPGYEPRSTLLSDESFIRNNRQPLRIVLLGKTGSGKSSTGNTILGEESFKACFSASSVTEMCQDVKGVRFGQEIHLIDTPGVFDTSKPNTQVLQEVSRCISMSLPGPHVFLLVVQAGRFTPEENDTVKHVAEVFGEDFFKHMILVFTGRDALEKDHHSFDEFLQTVPPTLDEIRKKCNKRCIAVDNSAKKESRAIDAGNLMEQINVLVANHYGKYYTNEMYEAAEKMCRDREEEIRRQKDQEKKKEKEDLIRQMKKEFQKDVDRMKAEKNSLEKKLHDCTANMETLEEKLHDSSVKVGEMTAIKKKLTSVQEEAQQYKEQAEDATRQRQVCLQNRDRLIAKQSKELDRKYENDMNFSIARSKSEAVYTMLRVGLQIGWGLFSFWFLKRFK